MAMSIEFLFFTEMDILFTYFLFTYLFIFWLQDDKIILLDLFLFLIAINQITFFFFYSLFTLKVQSFYTVQEDATAIQVFWHNLKYYFLI